MRHSIQRTCPRCGPCAFDFDRHADEGANVYECRNCLLEVTIKSRPAKVGGAKQMRVVAEVRQLLAKNYEERLDEANDAYWAQRGVVALSFAPKRWFDAGVLVYVGACGSLKVHDCEGKGKTRRAGQAWRWLEILGGRA